MTEHIELMPFFERENGSPEGFPAEGYVAGLRHADGKAAVELKLPTETVELTVLTGARLSLWLATLAHGRPLTFLDHRLRSGNSLVGATPDDLTRIASRGSRKREPLPLFTADTLERSMREMVRPLLELGMRPADTVADVRAKETLWERLAGASSPLACWRGPSRTAARSSRGSPRTTVACVTGARRTHDGY